MELLLLRLLAAMTADDEAAVETVAEADHDEMAAAVDSVAAIEADHDAMAAETEIEARVETQHLLGHLEMAV